MVTGRQKWDDASDDARDKDHHGGNDLDCKQRRDHGYLSLP